MAISGVEGVSSLDGVRAIGQSYVTPADFSQWMTEQVSTTNSNIQVAEQAVQQLALGEADNLHQVMIALSKAKTSFELTVQVRNKLLEGFQEVMKMSV